MAEKISDLSGEEREQRIAELKRRMQESAERNRAASGEASADTVAAENNAPASPSESAPTAVAEVVDEPIIDEISPPAEAVSAEKTTRPAIPPADTKVTAARSVNGSKPQAEPETTGPTKSQMNRREFLTYAWGGALGLLALEGLALSFQFMYPRFKAGEFGGVFGLDGSIPVPPPTAPPQAYPDGKFWMVSAEEEPKALYMVCTHLGCLYQWVESNNRFECPCHGSKFTRRALHRRPCTALPRLFRY